MLENTQKEFNSEVRRIAETAVLRKLKVNGFDKDSIDEYKFNRLVNIQIEFMKKDGEKVGAGFVGGVIISTLFGWLF